MTTNRFHRRVERRNAGHTPSISDVLEEYLRHHQNLDSRVEGRIVFE